MVSPALSVSGTDGRDATRASSPGSTKTLTSTSLAAWSSEPAVEGGQPCSSTLCQRLVGWLARQVPSLSETAIVRSNWGYSAREPRSRGLPSSALPTSLPAGSRRGIGRTFQEPSDGHRVEIEHLAPEKLAVSYLVEAKNRALDPFPVDA